MAKDRKAKEKKETVVKVGGFPVLNMGDGFRWGIVASGQVAVGVVASGAIAAGPGGGRLHRGGRGGGGGRRRRAEQGGRVHLVPIGRKAAGAIAIGDEAKGGIAIGREAEGGMAWKLGAKE